MPEHKTTESIRGELSAILEMISFTESIDKLPAIERDMILSKLRLIYEQISVTTHYSSETRSQAGHEPEPATEVEEDINSITLELEEPEEDVVAADTLDEVAGPPPGRIPDEKAAPADDQPVTDITEEPEKEIQAKTDEKSSDTQGKVQETPVDKQAENGRKSSPGIIAEKLGNDKQSVYETLAGKSSRDNLSTKLQSKPISDISAAIGINDKFQLIRDLFNGDSFTFKKTLEILNGATNFNEAFTYINENFDWDMESPSVQLILELVRRKFIVKKDE